MKVIKVPCTDLASPRWVIPSKLLRCLKYTVSTGGKKQKAKTEILYNYLHLGETFISALQNHHPDQKFDTPRYSQFSYHHIASTALYSVFSPT